ncbi:MAG TPA: ThiF family adenylyltransferase [archaeon]|nr:ThiF family adenylyltransferase [archaeon]
MALAPFFERVYGALGGHLAISRDSLSAVLDDVTVGILCGKDLDNNDIWIAELSTNLLARLYPRIAIMGPYKHVTTLRNIALKINPEIEFAENVSGAPTICVGAAIAEDAIYPNASGWVARVNHTPSKHGGPSNPYAAGAAAALACAEIFRRIFLKSHQEQDVSLSLLNFDKATGASLELVDENIGEVLFVGVGAVGNAALWALSRDTQTRGRLWLVDGEDVTLSNLQRYALTTYADVGRSKVLLGQSALSRSSLDVVSIQLTLEQFIETQGAIDIPVLVVSVDNVDGRRSAQALLPRLVVNGWTGEQALGASWHVLSRDTACLACLYHPHRQGASATEQAAKALGLTHDRVALLWVSHQPLSDEDIHTAAETLGVKDAVLEPWKGKSLGDLYTDVVCGSVPLDVTGVGRVETVPLAHQSALAGILMAAELLKRTQPGLAAISQSEPLISWDDVLRAPPTVWGKPRAREKGCICGDPDYQDIYAKKWS